MAYDEDLADRLRFLLNGSGATEQKMFGGLAFLIGGNMSVAASGQGGLMLRVDPGDTDDLLSLPGVSIVDMGRGPMQGWLRVSADVLDDDVVLKEWVDRSVGFATSLPPKR